MNRAALEAEFACNFTERGEAGASLSIWQNGRSLVELAGGWQDREQTIPWTAQTPVLVWSATKGPAAACLLHACQEKSVPLSALVAEIWPEFAAAGKGHITLAQLLSHQAGLSALDRPVPADDARAVTEALAAQAPAWTAGDAHGYHPRTFGYLLDELVLRLTQVPLREYWQRVFAQPLGLNFWIGLPPERTEGVATMYPPRRSPPKGDPFYTAYLTADSLTSRSFASPRGLASPSAMNTPVARAAGFSAFGGIGTAQALAKFYAMLAAGGELEGRRYFSPEILDHLTHPLTQGEDRVLLIPTAFSAGFMQDPLDGDGRKLRRIFGPSRTAFGQPGAGGSQAFADPAHGLSFAYVMNQMEPGVLPNEKSLRLIEALYAD